MKLGTISRNQIIGLVLFLEIVAAGLFIFYYVMPTNTKIGEVNKVIADMQREMRGIETTKKNLQELQREADEINRELARLEQQFKEELFITRTLMLLEVLAGNTNVDIVGFKPSSQSKGRAKKTSSAQQKPPAPNAAKPGAPAAAAKNQQSKKKTFIATQEFKETKFELYLVGQFQNIYNFISELKDFPKLVVLDSIDMSVDESSDAGAPTAGEKGSLQVKMPLTFYVQKSEPLVKLGGQSDEEAAAQEGEQGPVDQGAPPPLPPNEGPIQE